MNAISQILNPTTRRWVYGVAIAFVPLAVFLGWLKPEAIPVVLPLILAILNVQDEKTPYEHYQDGTGPIAPKDFR